jgi:hemerythrin
MTTTTKSKTILHEDTIPRVDLDFMNDTHFEEIEMVNRLGELISSYTHNNNKSQQDKISTLLHAWFEHTKAHFKRENELMLETGFPAYPIHSNEHELALSGLKNTVKAWQDNHDSDLLEDYIFNIWPTWFDGHVNTMDMMTAKFAVMNGYKNT